MYSHLFNLLSKQKTEAAAKAEANAKAVAEAKEAKT
jgi:hypothetical protein